MFHLPSGILTPQQWGSIIVSGELVYPGLAIVGEVGFDSAKMQYFLLIAFLYLPFAICFSLVLTGLGVLDWSSPPLKQVELCDFGWSRPPGRQAVQSRVRAGLLHLLLDQSSCVSEDGLGDRQAVGGRVGQEHESALGAEGSLWGSEIACILGQEYHLYPWLVQTF